MTRFITSLGALLLLVTFCAATAAEYPEMEGRWVGNIRVVSSDASAVGPVASGGASISEAELVFTVFHQDQEVFIGNSRSSTASRNSPGTNVWGAIRSNGQEALFTTNTGGNGLIWFNSSTEFEYCYTNMTEESATVFCAVLTKQEN